MKTTLTGVLVALLSTCAIADPTFIISTVDSGGTIGQWLQARLNGSQMELSYYDATRTGLKHAVESGGGWNLSYVDSLGAVGQYGSFTIDNQGRHSFVYLDDDRDMLKYAGWAALDHPQAVVSTVDSGGTIGQWLQARLNGSQMVLSYYDATRTGLKHAVESGGGWNLSYVDSLGAVGQYGSFTIDNQGRHSFVYLDDDRDMLKYAGWAALDHPQAVVMTIDSGNVGQYLRASKTGPFPTVVSYYDATDQAAKIATVQGHAFSVTTVPYSSTDYGEYMSVSINNLNRVGLAFLDDQRDSIVYAEAPNVLGISAGWVIGQVKNLANNLPISGARIILQSSSDADTAWTSGGSYGIGPVEPGTGYTVLASAYGFATRTLHNVNISSESITTLNIELIALPGAYAVRSLSPNPNPTISAIEAGGTIGRFYQTVDTVTGLPAPQVVIGVNSQDGNYQFISDEDGLLSITIPSTHIGNGSVGQTETFTIVSVAGQQLAPGQQIAFATEVLDRRFSKEWVNDSYIRLGFAFVRAELGQASQLKIVEADGSNGLLGDSLEIKRQKHFGGGVGAEASVGASLETSIVNASATAGAGAEAILSFTTEDEYGFPYENPTDWQAVAEYILIADGNITGLDEALTRLLGYMEEWYTSNHSIQSAYLSDARGMDLLGSVNAHADIGVRGGPGNLMEVAAGANVAGDGHVTFLVRDDQRNSILSVESGLTGTATGGIGVGLRFGRAYNSNATEGLNARLGFFAAASYKWGLGTRCLFDNTNNSWERLEFEISRKSTLGSNGTEHRTTITIDDPNQLTLVASRLPVISQLSSLLQSGGIATVNNSSCDITFHDGMEAIYSHQLTFPNTPPIDLITEKSDIVASPTFSLRISGSEVGNARIRSTSNVATSRVESRSRYVLGDILTIESYNDNPDIPVNYADIMQEIIDRTPLSVRIAAFAADFISFFFREGEQTFQIGEGGSTVHLGPTALPTGIDSIRVNSWGWYASNPAIQSNDLPSDKRQMYESIRSRREQYAGMKYGIGGFYQFEPSGVQWSDSVSISIHYQDEEIQGFDEDELAVYVENKVAGEWVFIGGTVDTSNNTVTALIDSLSNYTLAPRLPKGQFRLIPSSGEIPADDSSFVYILSDTIFNNDGTIVGNGELFTVSSSAGTVVSADHDSATVGLQIPAESGTIGFSLRSGLLSYHADVSVSSVRGTAHADTVVLFTDTVPPAQPDSVRVMVDNSQLLVVWDAVADSDLAGYRIYFDTDNAEPPYNGLASVYGLDSPIEAGLSTSRDVVGLQNNTTYYVAITAVDISGNESAYSEVTSGTPTFPGIEDLTIRVVGNEAYLRWSGLPNANWYDIYRAPNADATIEESAFVGSTYLPYYIVTAPDLSPELAFFFVVARQ